MIYLSGASHGLIRLFGAEGLGVLMTPRHWHQPDFGMTWAADNDCFNQGDKFDWDVFMKWLDGLHLYSHSCLFAPAPDVVGDAVATLRRGEGKMQQIRSKGFPAALVAQDGLTPKMVPWDEIDALFVGGSTAWKVSGDAYRCVQAGKVRGKWTHMGRVNSEQRFRLAYSWGVDSVDGTFLKFGPNKNWPILKRWLRNNLQGKLVLDLQAL